MFDQKLADEAQALIDKGVFKHSDWVELKSNGAAFAWGSLFPTFTAVIKNWHDEGAYYDYQTGAPKKPSQVYSVAVVVVVDIVFVVVLLFFLLFITVVCIVNVLPLLLFVVCCCRK